jgi:hypothetical protein
MYKVKHTGSCSQNMILTFDDPRRYNLAVAAVAGKRFQLTLEPEKSTRSNEQNRYYWGIIIEMIAVEFCGMATESDKDHVHRGLGGLFLRRKDEKTGLEYIESTTKLSVQEFQDYLQQCRHWAAENGLSIPEPNEVELPEERL